MPGGSALGANSSTQLPSFSVASQQHGTAQRSIQVLASVKGTPPSCATEPATTSKQACTPYCTPLPMYCQPLLYRAVWQHLSAYPCLAAPVYCNKQPC